MPQIIIEFSDNIKEKNSFPELFKAIHELLPRIISSPLAGCKSRAMERKNYYIGNGEKENAFVHLNLKILPGRSVETREELGELLMALLKANFTTSIAELKMQITLEINELTPFYFKYAS